jgi:hypothetical protein
MRTHIMHDAEPITLVKTFANLRWLSVADAIDIIRLDDRNIGDAVLHFVDGVLGHYRIGHRDDLRSDLITGSHLLVRDVLVALASLTPSTVEQFHQDRSRMCAEVSALIEQVGGREAFVALLDTLSAPAEPKD